MSRPQKIHKPIKATFNQILGIVAIGNAAGKRASVGLAKAKKRSKSVPKPKGQER